MYDHIVRNGGVIFSFAVGLLATLFHSHTVGQIGIFSNKGAQGRTDSTWSFKAGKEAGAISEILLSLPVASFIFLYIYIFLNQKQTSSLIWIFKYK